MSSAGASPSIPKAIIRAVLAKVTDPLQFERACAQLISFVEGGAFVVTTTQNYDRGTDARTVGTRERVRACVSLRSDFSDKAQSDLKKLAQFEPRVSRVYFCSNQDITEDQRLKLERTLQPIFPGVELEILGLHQLVEIAERSPASITRCYPNEIEACRALHAPWEEETPEELEALRLALMTMTGDDTAAIRNHVYAASVRRALADGQARSIVEIANEISRAFRLGRSLPNHVVRLYVDNLLDAGELQRADDGRFSLSAGLFKDHDVDEEAASTALLEGRETIREQWEKDLGSPFIDEQFQRIWNRFITELTKLLFYRGKQVVGLVSSVLDGTAIEESSDEKLMDSLCESVSQEIDEQVARSLLKTCIRDLFVEKNRPGFEWLTRVCGAFIAISTLGLEATSGNAIAAVLSGMTVVLDTDVVLSLIAVGEQNHEAVSEMVLGLRGAGAVLLYARPVLFEVAYHAWIAPADYREVHSLLPVDRVDADRVITNAFVRSFNAMLLAARTKKRQWDNYLAGFKGSSSADSSKIASILRGDHRFGELPVATAQYAKRKSDYVAKLLRGQSDGSPRNQDEKKRGDKANRDAELYTQILSFSAKAADSGSALNCILISSSGRLRRLHDRKEESGEVVLSIAAILHLLALAPNVRLGLSAMRAMLFDHVFLSGLSGVEVAVHRVIKSLPDCELPWARRTVLKREIGDRLYRMARQEGRPIADIVTPTEPSQSEDRVDPTLVEVLREALDATGLTYKLELQNAELRRRVRELEQEVEKRRR